MVAPDAFTTDKSSNVVITKQVAVDTSAQVKIQQELQALKSRLNDMLETNSKAPELERLETDEFLIDTEEKARLEQEMLKDVKKVRRGMEIENLKKRVLRDRFKVRPKLHWCTHIKSANFGMRWKWLAKVFDPFCQTLRPGNTWKSPITPFVNDQRPNWTCLKKSNSSAKSTLPSLND